MDLEAVHVSHVSHVIQDTWLSLHVGSNPTDSHVSHVSRLCGVDLEAVHVVHVSRQTDGPRWKIQVSKESQVSIAHVRHVGISRVDR